MEDLKGKLKNLFSGKSLHNAKQSMPGYRFQGQGHKLGGGDTGSGSSSSAAAPQQQHPTQRSQRSEVNAPPTRPPPPPPSSSSSGSRTTSARPPAVTQPPAASSAKPTATRSPAEPPAAAAKAPTVTGQSHLPPPQHHQTAAAAAAPPPAAVPPPPPPPPAAAAAAAAAVVSEETQVALGLLMSSGKGHLTAGTLRKVFGNIVSDPGNPKFRRLRMLNAKVQETVTGVPGGLELLVAAGFDVVFEADESSGAEEGWAVWGGGQDNLEAIRGCVAALNDAFPLPPPNPPPPGAAAAAAGGGGAAAAASSGGGGGAATGAAAAGGGGAAAAPQAAPAAVPSASPPPPGAPHLPPAQPAAAPVERNTRVYLPGVNPDAFQDPDAGFYSRSASECASDMKARASAREAQTQLTTRAWKERQRGPKTVHKRAQIRVRMPDGLMLEGNFGAKEELSAVFQWVSDCLRHQWAEYDLYSVHKKLEGSATVGGAELCPSSVLNFRWLEPDNPLLAEGTSLSDAVLLTSSSPSSS